MILGQLCLILGLGFWYFRTHLAMEPMAVSLKRNMSTMHPVYKLLKPYLRWGLLDCTRHVIKRSSNPCFLSNMTSCDVASTIHQSVLMDSARHAITRILNPRFLS